MNPKLYKIIKKTFHIKSIIWNRLKIIKNDKINITEHIVFV